MSKSTGTKKAKTSKSSSPDYSTWDLESIESALGFDLVDIEAQALALITAMIHITDVKAATAVKLVSTALFLRFRSDEIEDFVEFSELLNAAMLKYTFPLSEQAMAFLQKEKGLLN